MDIYQYPLADFCCEVYDSCTIEQFNDPKLRQAVIDRLDASIDAAIEDFYTGEPPLSAPLAILVLETLPFLSRKYKKPDCLDIPVFFTFSAITYSP